MQNRSPTELRAGKVLGFFVGKGLLEAVGVQARPNTKVSLKDALWVGMAIDRRVLEVLPAALIHFPKSFRHVDQIPEKLQAIVSEIKRGATSGHDYEGIEFRLMAARARQILPDRRLKPIGVRKITKCYRLRPTIVAQMKASASARGLTETAYLESLVLADYRKRG